jgi:hypothetical protein
MYYIVILKYLFLVNSIKDMSIICSALVFGNICIRDGHHPIHIRSVSTPTIHVITT